MKVLYISLITILLGYGKAFSQPVHLNPDNIDHFVMDPETFNEYNPSNSVWELAPFGRKDPTIYRASTNENNEAIITAESKSSISNVQIKLNAKPQNFPIIEWKCKID